MNKLQIFIATLIFTFFASISAEKVEAINAFQLITTENAVNSKSESSIRPPAIPPLYYISKEEIGTQTLLEFGRNHFNYIHIGQIVPDNFYFKNDLIPTSILIDYKTPVPLYIQGHALRH